MKETDEIESIWEGLAVAAGQLNAAGDAADEMIRRTTQALSGLGIAYWMTSDTGPLFSDGNMLGWTKHGARWALVVSDRTLTPHYTRLLQNANRARRIEAAKLLPTFLKNMLKLATEAARERR